MNRLHQQAESLGSAAFLGEAPMEKPKFDLEDPEDVTTQMRTTVEACNRTLAKETPRTLTYLKSVGVHRGKMYRIPKSAGVHRG